MIALRGWLLGLALVSTLPALASEPILPSLRIGLEEAPLYGLEAAPPGSAVLHKILLDGILCSAPGSPAARYKLSEGQLWLIGFKRCGPELSLAQAYGRPMPPILAEWVSGRLRWPVGKLTCYNPYGESVGETTLVLRVERGQVVAQEFIDESGKPYLKKDATGQPFRCRD